MKQTINGTNGIISFGQVINSYKSLIRPEVVLTEEVLQKTFPMTFTIKLPEGQETQRDLRFHFCDDMHVDITAAQYEDFKHNENYDSDERVFYVSD